MPCYLSAYSSSSTSVLAQPFHTKASVLLIGCLFLLHGAGNWFFFHLQGYIFFIQTMFHKYTTYVLGVDIHWKIYLFFPLLLVRRYEQCRAVIQKLKNKILPSFWQDQTRLIRLVGSWQYIALFLIGLDEFVSLDSSYGMNRPHSSINLNYWQSPYCCSTKRKRKMHTAILWNKHQQPWSGNIIVDSQTHFCWTSSSVRSDEKLVWTDPCLLSFYNGMRCWLWFLFQQVSTLYTSEQHVHCSLMSSRAGTSCMYYAARLVSCICSS